MGQEVLFQEPVGASDRYPLIFVGSSGSVCQNYARHGFWPRACRLRGILPVTVAAIDFGLLLIAAEAAFPIYFDGVNNSAIEPARDAYIAPAVFAAALFVVVFERIGGYRVEQLSRLHWQSTRTVMSWAAIISVLLLFAFLQKISASYSRGWTIAWMITAPVLLLTGRGILHLFFVRWIRDGYLKRRVAVVGATDLTSNLIARLALPNSDSEIVGIFDDCSPTSSPITLGHLAGTVSDLVELARTELVDQVIIALPLAAGPRIAELARRFQTLPVDVTVYMDHSTVPIPVRDIQQVHNVWVLRLYKTPLDPAGSLIKAIEDKVISVGAVALLGPLLLLIALAIKLDSPGPILFRQKRYGYRNEIFELFKFRTMYANSTDAAGARLTERGDPRVTQVGRFLRKYSLDELPQLFNVLKGEMSVVGPRPHAIAATAAGIFYADTADNYPLRHRIKPGLTGWAQVNGWRGPTDTLEEIQGRLAHDIYYVENWSILLDFKILFRTARAVIEPPSTAF